MTAALQYFEWCCLCCWSNLETLAWKCFCIFKIIGLCMFLNVEVTFNIVLNMHLHLLLYMNVTKIIPHYLVILKTFRKKKKKSSMSPTSFLFFHFADIYLTSKTVGFVLLRMPWSNNYDCIPGSGRVCSTILWTFGNVFAVPAATSPSQRSSERGQ